MPIIPPPSGLPDLAIIALQTTTTGQLTGELRLASNIQISTVCTGVLGGAVEGASNVQISTTVSGQLRKNDEADVFGDSNIQISTTVSGQLNLAIIGRASIRPSTAVTGVLTKREADIDEIRYIVDIVPPADTSNYKYQHWKLTVDGVVLDCRDFSFRSDKGRIGEELTVTLANHEQRPLITSASSVKFEIGKEWNGVWSNLRTLVDEAEMAKSNFSLAELGRDTFQFSSVGNLAIKLNKTPETDLVIYDTSKMELSLENFDILTDNYGRSYITELFPFANLKLYDLFNEIFVNRCGFTAYRTNLPNFPLSRIDCKIGKKYLDSIGPFFGYCNPDIDVIGDEIQIMDSSFILPEGSPEPRNVTASQWATAQLDANLQPVDAIRLSYTEDKRNFDYYTIDEQTDTHPLTGEGDQRQSFETVVKRIREYRKFSNPFAVIKRDIESEVRTTTTDDVMVNRVTETFSYDQWGRLTNREKIVEALVPTFSTLILDIQLSFQTFGREYETVTYKAHPFQSRLQYIASRSVQKYEATVTEVDPEAGTIAGPFALKKDYQAGNVKTGMIVHVLRQVETLEEKATPKRGGLTDVEIIRIDQLRSLVLDKYQEERPGDVSLNGFAPQRMEKLIFLTDADTRTDLEIVELDVGELPLFHAEPFAQRYLRRLQDKPNGVVSDVIGDEPIHRKGAPFALKNEDAESIGNFMCESIQIQGNADTGVIITTLTGREI